MSRRIGLDLWAIGTHVFVTIAVVVAFSSAVLGRNAEVGIPLILAGSAVLFEWRRRRALRNDSAAGLTTGEVQLERVADLEARMADVEVLHARVAELEERLDFSERLLAQGREASSVPRGGPG